MALDRFYTIDEVAEILHMHQRTVYQWVYDGKLTAVKSGRRWLIAEAVLKSHLSGETTQPKA